jgi:hypothetical protein
MPRNTRQSATPPLERTAAPVTQTITASGFTAQSRHRIGSLPAVTFLVNNDTSITSVTPRQSGGESAAGTDPQPKDPNVLDNSPEGPNNERNR